MAQTRHRALLTLLFMLLGSISEGLSILVLVPILRLVARSDAGESVIQVPSFRFLGVTWPAAELSLALMLGGVVVLIAARALFMRFKTIYMAELFLTYTDALRRNLYTSLARARWAFIARRRASDFQHVLTAELNRVERAAYGLLTLAQSLVLGVVYLAVSSLVSPMMTLFAFSAGAIVLVVLRPLRRRAAALGSVLTENSRGLSQTVSDFLTGVKVAKSFGVEPTYVAEFESRLSSMRHDQIAFMRLSSLGSALFQLSAAIAISAFVYVALDRMAMEVAELLVLILLFTRLAPLFPQMQRDAQQLLFDIPAFDSIERIRAESDAAREPEPEFARPAPPLARVLRFEHVRFRYADEPGEDTLRDLSFEIPAGRITCLVGPSGSGKSTVADMLLGLLDPADGAITVDGVPIDAFGRRNWRAQVAYVPQDVFLLHDTIGANLRLAAADASEDRLWAALAAAHAEDFVRRLPQGLETVVGDRGVRLSGGERQRIALARALLRRPQLLVLDEATSALDWQSQEAIARSIESLRGKTTVVTIAHRLSMIAFADWVVALENGAVVETGPYAELARAADSQLAKLVSGERADASGVSRDPRSTPAESRTGPDRDGAEQEPTSPPVDGPAAVSAH